MAEVRFACACGTVTGRLTDVGPAMRQGSRIDCFCRDCRGALLWLGRDAPEGEPVRYYQTTPDRVVFDTGADRLAAFAWRQPTLLRWYAGCCRTALFNTTAGPGMPFVSACLDAIPDPEPLGPVTGRAFVRRPDGTRGHERAARLVLALLRRSVPARLSGRWRQTPFFDLATQTPVAPPRIVTAQERAGLGMR